MSPPSRIFFCTYMELDNITSLDWEEWRDIPWYEWLYQVSNMWRVKSFRRWRTMVLKPSKITWWLWVRLIGKTYKVHRLVASAFLWLWLDSFVDQKHSICVCHHNDDPSDNRLDNLFLWTKKDNNTDKIKKWRARYWYMFGDKNPMYWVKWSLNKNSKKVKQFSIDWTFINEWDSMASASRHLNIHDWFKAISRNCKWKTNTAYWFIWKISE